MKTYIFFLVILLPFISTAQKQNPQLWICANDSSNVCKFLSFNKHHLFILQIEQNQLDSSVEYSTSIDTFTRLRSRQDIKFISRENDTIRLDTTFAKAIIQVKQESVDFKLVKGYIDFITLPEKYFYKSKLDWKLHLYTINTELDQYDVIMDAQNVATFTFKRSDKIALKTPFDLLEINNILFLNYKQLGVFLLREIQSALIGDYINMDGKLEEVWMMAK